MRASSSSGPLVFNWTDVSDGRPALTIAQTNGQNVMVGWPLGTATNWVLESASDVSAPTWTSVTNAPATLDRQSCVLPAAGAAQQYFRMRYVP
jgi:hypothetical protein